MARKKNEELAEKKKLSGKDIIKIINKKSGFEVAFDLTEDNPSEVVEWIPICEILNKTIARGKDAGIPVGKISEIAGLSGVGKSFMAAVIAANAQKMNKTVVYFDAESALDPEFLERAGCNVEDVIYVQAKDVEFVFETIETLLKDTDESYLFIWDSYALTPTAVQVEKDHDKQNAIAIKPRVVAQSMQKILQPIANRQATLLVLNQLKTNISPNMWEMIAEPFVAPGGETIKYPMSLRIWLTGKKGKAAAIFDERGYKIGSETSALIKKSRFGTEMRSCKFRILWGDEVRIADEEYWLEAIKAGDGLTGGAAGRYTLHHADGSEQKFLSTEYTKLLKTDERFKARVLELLHTELVVKFENKEGDASQFYKNVLEDEDDDGGGQDGEG